MSLNAGHNYENNFFSNNSFKRKGLRIRLKKGKQRRRTYWAVSCGRLMNARPSKMSRTPKKSVENCEILTNRLSYFLQRRISRPRNPHANRPRRTKKERVTETYSKQFKCALKVISRAENLAERLLHHNNHRFPRTKTREKARKHEIVRTDR